MDSNQGQYPGPRSLPAILRAEWPWWLSGAILSLFLASVLLSGWPAGLLPNLAYPYTYHGDSLFYSWLIRCTMEGWIFDNPRSGYPFGADFFDFPVSDTGSLLVLKLLGSLTGKYHIALNIYYLLSFAVIFIASYGVLRAIGLQRTLAVSAAALFDFLPFHFQRLGHLFYSWYFVVPLFFHVAFLLFFANASEVNNKRRYLQYAGMSCVFVFLASFGVYYALFGTIILVTAGIAGWAGTGRVHHAWRAVAAALLLSFGVLLNTAPNLMHIAAHGVNPEGVFRTPAASETLGLKMMQLVLPRDDHRIERLAKMKARYNNISPLINENISATLGAVGTAGFLLLGLTLLMNLAGRSVDPRLALLSLLVLVLYLFGSVGGLGAFFSWFLTAAIRSWNRVSICIAFGAITAFFLAVQIGLDKWCSPARAKIILILLLPAVLIIGLSDQTVPASRSRNETIRSAYETDRDFIRRIENSLPRGSAIYQLPYMPFPEFPPRHRLHTYDLVAGFIHSSSLRWSYGGMKGREGDLFYRALAGETIDRQLDIIQRLGFAGIYIDRRGFADDAQKLISRMTQLAGPPAVVRADNEVLFFRLKPNTDTNLEGLTDQQIIERTGFVPMGPTN